MQYKQVSIDVKDNEQAEILLAQMSDIGFEGFEETSGKLIAYISDDNFNKQDLDELFSVHNLSFELSDVAEQNWNAVWEENFQPVVVPGFCTVRAHFHDIPVTTPHDIVITPQMSFGTGHHATTMLMMMQMQRLDLAGKSVLDFGSGTGILAILAEQLEAAKVTAIDNDSWAYENAKENIDRNSCTKITPLLGSLGQLDRQHFDVILANINRNILLTYMSLLYEMTANGGKVLMSGILREDLETIKAAALREGFSLENSEELNNWIVLLFKK